MRIKEGDLDLISQRYHVEVVTPEERRSPFRVPLDVQERRALGSSRYQQMFERFIKDGNIRAVDHGEFGQCAKKLVDLCATSDFGTSRKEVVCLQRCRRGGKTFMATAVAAMLEYRFNGDAEGPFVIYISMNQMSKLSPSETAMGAVLSRIAYELADEHQSFLIFRKKYSSFAAVEEWVTNNNVILLIDELNIIPFTRETYDDMSTFLDAIAGKKSCALLYTTHHRIMQDLRRGREGEEPTDHLSTRPHHWQPMPRLNALACVRHMKRREQFWSAVLRGRIPALLVLPPDDIASFVPAERIESESRGLMYDAILDGSIERLESGRNAFRSFAYLLKSTDDRSIHLWPPFLCAQESVLGKDCPQLRIVLQSPDINHPKAFEALAELAVALQLMSSRPRYRNVVPRHPSVSIENCIDATAIFEIEDKYQTIEAVRKAVERRLEDDKELYAEVLQIVVIPQYSEFPIYDFFLFHRNQRWQRWRGNHCTIAAGYQCKYGWKYPSRDQAADKRVKLSVWIEGKGPSTRRTNRSYGWTLLSPDEHRRFLGESLFASLPPSDDEDAPCPYCNNSDFNFSFHSNGERVWVS